MTTTEALFLAAAGVVLIPVAVTLTQFIAARTTALSWAAAITAFLALVGGLLAFGQWLSGEAMPTTPPYLNSTYVRGLGTEVGGAGLDALLVGGVAGLISTWLHRWREVDAQHASIRHRRRRGRPVQLAEELAKSSGALQLWGGGHAGDRIEDKVLRRTRFSNRGRDAAHLRGVVFEACDLTKVSFRNCVLTDVQFPGSELTACDFRGATFSTTTGASPFMGSKLTRCRFDGAVIDGVDLGGDHGGSAFWRAEVRDGHLPRKVFAAMGPNAAEDLPGMGDGYRIVSFVTYLRGLDRGRLLFLARNLLARPL